MKKNKIVKALVLLQALLLVLIISACGKNEVKENEVSDKGSDKEQSVNDNNSDTFELSEEGKLTFASEGAFKPFNYMDGDQMIGFDIDVANSIAEKLGLEPNPIKARFDGIVLGVQNKRYDTAVASLTITEERKEFVNFTQPYYATRTKIYTRTDSDIETMDDLNDKEIAVSRGTTFKELALEYTDSSNIKEYDGDVVALQALAEGHHDAVITNNMIGQKAIEEGLNIVEKEEDLMVNKAGIAVAKENDKLLEAIDQALKEMKESGELKELAMKWIGVDITASIDE